MIERVVLRCIPKDFHCDPYRWYYRRRQMTHGSKFLVSPFVWSDVDHFFMGGQEYQLNFVCSNDFVSEYYRLMTTFGELEIKRGEDPEKVPLSLQTYVSMLRSFGRKAGFSILDAKEIVARD